ncbi:MAG: methylenetetrahydrofolate reductase, partial [Rhizobiaceae bacterium]|nr:methylenetetrahydrofolate reductase [Rhizobiaceae bacterium]
MAEQAQVTQAALVRKAQAKTDYKPADVSPQRRVQSRYTMRRWSVRHARGLEWLYKHFASVFLVLHPVWKTLGYGR